MLKPEMLVTGASGFIGRHAIPYFNKRYNTTAISFKDKSVSEVELKSYQVILHLAGIAHQTTELPASYYHDVNYTLTVDLAKKAKKEGVTHFVFLSSVKVYGEHPVHPVNEQSQCHPEDAYAKSKFEAEKEILKLNSDSFTVTVIRPALVYGKDVKGNLDKLIALTKKYPVIPLGNIHNKRSLVYIGNLLALIDTILEKKQPGIFIACDVNDISTTNLIATFSRHLGLKRTLLPIPGILKWIIKKAKPSVYHRIFGSFVVDNSVTKRQLDFIPPYSFEGSMKQMFAK